jgi:hypothetical protein
VGPPTRPEDGLQDASELEKMGEIEDTVSRHVSAQLDGIYVGRFTCEGSITYVFYLPAKQAERVEDLESIIGDLAPYEWEWLTDDDPEWDYFTKFLYPDAVSLEAMANRQLLENLEKRGDRLEVSRDVDHLAYFPTHEHATVAAEKLQELGFRTDEVKRSEDDEHRWVLEFHRVVAACNGPGATSTSFTTPGVTTRPDDTSSGESSSTTDGSSSVGQLDRERLRDSSGHLDHGRRVPGHGHAARLWRPMMGCKGKIDFLFVISRAGLMWWSQDKLVAGVPELHRHHPAASSTSSTSTSWSSTAKWTGGTSACDQCNGPCDVAPGYPCTYSPTKCDETMGAGTVYNAGPTPRTSPAGSMSTAT